MRTDGGMTYNFFGVHPILINFHRSIPDRHERAVPAKGCPEKCPESLLRILTADVNAGTSQTRLAEPPSRSRDILRRARKEAR